MADGHRHNQTDPLPDAEVGQLRICANARPERERGRLTPASSHPPIKSNDPAKP
jgi:hypothetical protein